MTERQREVLEALAHIRIAPEQAWATTNRVNTLVGRRGVSARGVLGRLEYAGLVERKTLITSGRHQWRITAAGRSVLND